MWPYWIIFAYPAFATLSAAEYSVNAHARIARSKRNLAWYFSFAFLTVMIGYRFEVGGDWTTYLGYLYGVEDSNIIEVLSKSDPGYQVLNWLSYQLDFGIYGVNLFSAFIFSYGLIKFCQHQARPWLSMTVATPYLVNIVAMGYTRQAVALGLTMAGLVSLAEGSTVIFVLWTFCAVLFHKSAVILMPIAALAAAKNRAWTFFWVGIVAFFSYRLFLENDTSALYAGYVEAKYQSEGAGVRLAMNGVPAVMLLLWRKKFYFSDAEIRLWVCFSFLSLILVGLFFISPSSTAVDRIALYMLPLQLAIFSRLPDVFVAAGQSGQNVVAGIVLYYATVQIVWFNFAQTAFAWLPYRFYPLEVLH